LTLAVQCQYPLMLNESSVVHSLQYFLQVSHCKLPCLAIALTLRHDREAELSKKSSLSVAGISGVVAFVSGLLLDNDTNVRNWFSLCIRNGLKVTLVT